HGHYRLRVLSFIAFADLHRSVRRARSSWPWGGLRLSSGRGSCRRIPGPVLLSPAAGSLHFRQDDAEHLLATERQHDARGAGQGRGRGSLRRRSQPGRTGTPAGAHHAHLHPAAAGPDQVKPTFRTKWPSLRLSAPPPAQCTRNASKMMARITTTTQKKNTMMPGMAYPATVLALATACQLPAAGRLIRRVFAGDDDARCWSIRGRHYVWTAERARLRSGKLPVAPSPWHCCGACGSRFCPRRRPPLGAAA